MILFLDDNLDRTKAFKSYFPQAITTETAQETIDVLANKENEFELVFLDHDLGGETYVDSSGKNTGMEVVRWIVANKPKVGKFVVHSCNIYAATAMTDTLLREGYEVERIPFTYLLEILNRK